MDKLQRLLITHTDLDGVGCAVVWTAITGAPYRLVDNGDVDEAVAIGLAEADELVLADHSITEPCVPLVEAHIARGGRFAMLDHHKSALPLRVHPWATIDQDRSGTGLLFDYLGRPERLREFADLVEDHDLWRHTDPRSSQLAGLLGMVGEERFLARFVADPRVTFSDGELLLMEVEARREADYIARRLEEAEVIEIQGARWAMVFAEEYRSTLADALFDRFGVDATAIVNANSAKVTVSMRGRNLDVSLIGEANGGGGHARAAAFSARTAGIDGGRGQLREAILNALRAGPEKGPPA